MAKEIELVEYDKACRQIARARSADELSKIREKAMMLKACAKIAQNKQLEADAWEIRARAERRLGQMMEEGKDERASEGRPKTGSDETRFRPTLNGMSIGKSLANRARRLAELTDKDFGLVVIDGRRQEVERHVEREIAKKSKPKARKTKLSLECPCCGKALKLVKGKLVRDE